LAVEEAEESSMGKLDGKVALISGVARGQGRSHAVRMAEEGADIIGFDLCSQVDTVSYPMSTPDDLQETVRLVEELDRRIVVAEADVRDSAATEEVVAQGVGEFGRLDIVCANAGIVSFTDLTYEMSDDEWQDMIDINLTGVWRTCKAAIPHMIEAGNGGSIVITSSTAGIKGMARFGHYVATKHAVVGLARSLANELAEYSIRVNTVHPTGVETPMVVNDEMPAFMEKHPEMGENMVNALPVEMVAPEDISNAIIFLSSEDARYITGVMLPVDAGMTQR
jgi:SDR family mycofactocin-dependent oxidoreductase